MLEKLKIGLIGLLSTKGRPAVAGSIAADLSPDFLRAANKGYGQLPLGERDLELRDKLEASMVASGGDLIVSEECHGPVLRLLAERLASIAVRFHDPELLVTALRALFLGSSGDHREALAILPLIHRSAQLIGLDADELAVVAAESFAEPAATEVRAFGTCPIRSITVMGYQEIGSGQSFRFDRTW